MLRNTAAACSPVAGGGGGGGGGASVRRSWGRCQPAPQRSARVLLHGVDPVGLLGAVDGQLRHEVLLAVLHQPVLHLRDGHAAHVRHGGAHVGLLQARVGHWAVELVGLRRPAPGRRRSRRGAARGGRLPLPEAPVEVAGGLVQPGARRLGLRLRLGGARRLRLGGHLSLGGAGLRLIARLDGRQALALRLLRTLPVRADLFLPRAAHAAQRLELLLQGAAAVLRIDQAALLLVQLALGARQLRPRVCHLCAHAHELCLQVGRHLALLGVLLRQGGVQLLLVDLCVVADHLLCSCQLGLERCSLLAALLLHLGPFAFLALGDVLQRGAERGLHKLLQPLPLGGADRLARVAVGAHEGVELLRDAVHAHALPRHLVQPVLRRAEHLLARQLRLRQALVTEVGEARLACRHPALPMGVLDAVVAHRDVGVHGARDLQAAAVLLVELLQLAAAAGVERLAVRRLGGLRAAAALCLRNTLPGGGDARHGAVVDGIHVRLCDPRQHGPRERHAAHALGLPALEDGLGQRRELCAELGAQLRRVCRLQPLQQLLVVDRPDQGEALAVWEEVLDGGADLVLGLHGGAAAADGAQRGLQVVARREVHAVLLQLQVEVAK
mmetsp:Transcript_15229/g.39200  ORF Transcript_15229/g.39200 Transcript_15229/m.39200 type:complete len:611 (-) Transcript_15229:669-2501(-)